MSFLLIDSKWCLGRESNPHAPKDTGFSYQLRLSPPTKLQFVVWTLPSPFTIFVAVRREPSSLYTFLDLYETKKIY